MDREKSRIERLSERLNSRTRYKAPRDTREPIPPVEEEAPQTQTWDTPNIDEILQGERRQPEPYPLMKKIFLVSLIFAVCAMGAAAIIYFKGDNFISTKNLEIEVEAPVSIKAGSPVELQVSIVNKNNAPIENVNMSVIYPDGTKDALQQDEDLTHQREKVESLGSGDRKTLTQKAIFFGSEGEVKTIRISVNYKVQGSNATFTKDKTFDLTIGSAPVSISVNRPEVVTSGEEFSLTFTITSNSEETLRGVIFKAEYPYGWRLSSATPNASDTAKSIWLLGDLPPGAEKVIKLDGILTGEDNDERTLRFFVGLGTVKGLNTTLAADSTLLAINRPDIDLSVKLNNDSESEYVAPAGREIQGVVNFQNNLSSNLLNPQITVTLSGGALDRATVLPQGGGFYNSSNNTITWSQGNTQNLLSLRPGDSGSVGFKFSTLPNLPVGTANQKINLTITLSGREEDSNTERRVSDTRTVKIASAVIMNAYSLYSKGPFGNSGPIPPKAEEETSYTILLRITNTQNEVLNGGVMGTLGPNVKWLGAEESLLTYNESTNTFFWEAGTIPSGTGFTTPAKEIYFRVSLTPSLGQVGGAPVLINNLVFEGMDSFTKANLRLTSPAVTTKISSDPQYVQGDETVVK